MKLLLFFELIQMYLPPFQLEPDCLATLPYYNFIC